MYHVKVNTVHLTVNGLRINQEGETMYLLPYDYKSSLKYMAKLGSGYDSYLLGVF